MSFGRDTSRTRPTAALSSTQRHTDLVKPRARVAHERGGQCYSCYSMWPCGQCVHMPYVPVLSSIHIRAPRRAHTHAKSQVPSLHTAALPPCTLQAVLKKRVSPPAHRTPLSTSHQHHRHRPRATPHAAALVSRPRAHAEPAPIPSPSRGVQFYLFRSTV